MEEDERIQRDQALLESGEVAGDPTRRSSSDDDSEAVTAAADGDNAVESDGMRVVSIGNGSIE